MKQLGAELLLIFMEKSLLTPPTQLNPDSYLYIVSKLVSIQCSLTAIIQHMPQVNNGFLLI